MQATREDGLLGQLRTFLKLEPVEAGSSVEDMYEGKSTGTFTDEMLADLDVKL